MNRDIPPGSLFSQPALTNDYRVFVLYFGKDNKIQVAGNFIGIHRLAIILME